MGLREWIAASDPSALGFLGGMLFALALVVVIDAIQRK